jgi:hypothetical protein
MKMTESTYDNEQKETPTNVRRNRNAEQDLPSMQLKAIHIRYHLIAEKTEDRTDKRQCDMLRNGSPKTFSLGLLIKKDPAE